MINLNNPLVLFSVKLLGIGIEISIEHVDGVYKLCAYAEAIAWSYCKKWEM